MEGWFPILLWIATCIVLIEFAYCELIALDSETATVPQLNLTPIIGFLQNALSIARLFRGSREAYLISNHHHVSALLPCYFHFSKASNITCRHWVNIVINNTHEIWNYKVLFILFVSHGPITMLFSIISCGGNMPL